MITAWRSQIRDNAVTTLQAFAVANSTLVDRVYRSRPQGLAERKAVFVGGIREDLALDSGTISRDTLVDIVASHHLADNAETTDNIEEVADALIDWLSANTRAHAFGANTVQNPVRSESVELDEGNGIIVPAVVITCRARLMEGRD
jgi:hypothetical protein